MSKQMYDYAIIGAGAAGLHLCMAVLEETWFSDKNILLLEKSDKSVNDKTWSFWEKEAGSWDSILKKSWEKGSFIGKKEEIYLELSPYRYKTLHAIDFYNYCKEKINHSNNIHWVKDEVTQIEGDTFLQMHGKTEVYTAKQVFDSRMETTETDTQKFPYLAQHFKGWEIQTEQPVFDPSSFIMMDYRIRKENTTSFTYVLPYSAHHALVEFTLFTPDIDEKEDYDLPLKHYISECLKIENYNLIKEEFGIIPMTSYPYHKASQGGIFKIGTAGSWVKPSSGYAFKNIEKCARQLVKNIINQTDLSHQLLHPKFRFYDAILLTVLEQQNHLGPSIFTEMFRNNSVQQIFKFLDDETNLLEDLSIINSFTYAPFLKGLFRYLWR